MSTRSFILENDSENILNSFIIQILNLYRFDISFSLFFKIKLLILVFILSYYAFRSTVFIVKKYLLNSKILSLDRKRKMKMTTLTVLALPNIALK